MHCWNVLQHEQKWTDQRPAKKQKSSSREGPRSCTPETNESHLGDEEQGPNHTSPRKGRPIGKKEKDRRGKNLVAHGENLYMEAMENMWLKREKAEELREIRKKERNDQRLAVETRRLELKQEVENRKLDLKQRELPYCFLCLGEVFPLIAMRISYGLHKCIYHLLDNTPLYNYDH